MVEHPIPQVKICGLTRPDDARIAAEAGARYLGTIRVEGSPRYVEAGDARRIGEAAPELPLVLVVADEPVDRLVAHARESGARVLQLHGSEPPEYLAEVRSRGGWELWKARRVRSSDEILRTVDRYREVADLLLLDAWHPEKLGGTGELFPWPALEAVRGEWPDAPRLGVAGGLVPENVDEAIRRLRPQVVDVSSGVEARPGVKDPERLRAFLARARTPSSLPGGSEASPI